MLLVAALMVVLATPAVARADDVAIRAMSTAEVTVGPDDHVYMTGGWSEITAPGNLEGRSS